MKPYTIKIFLAAFIFLFVSFNCTRHQAEEVDRGVYFWKTNFSLKENEIDWIRKNNIRKIYLRFFDVDWNPQIKAALPAGDVSIITKYFDEAEIIPVVFITNRTFKNIPDSLVPELAGNIYSKIFSKLLSFDTVTVREIQMDCDWTKTTRSKYFRLIELLQQLCSRKQIEITATIRLHQVKFSGETGIPPVKAGALMFYNMSDVSNIRTINSIFDKNIAGMYLNSFHNYPLRFDVILPAFSWGCLFRKSKLIDLINDLKEQELSGIAGFTRLNENYYRVNRNCRMNGIGFLEGDYVRIEHLDPDVTLKAAEMIAPHILHRKITVSLYNLNNELINNYENENVEKIFSVFN